jgi:hypothetical protein
VNRLELEGKVGLERCGPPLELALAHAFSRLSRFEWRDEGAHPWVVGTWPGWFLTLFAQPQYGRYWPDFAITGESPRHPNVSAPDNALPPFIVIIEVDGHEFHEKTKEQAEHDRRRDRFMTSTNARLFRFTGSEVFRDADACALEVFEHVIELQEQNLDAAFEDWLHIAAKHRGH